MFYFPPICNPCKRKTITFKHFLDIPCKINLRVLWSYMDRLESSLISGNSVLSVCQHDAKSNPSWKTWTFCFCFLLRLKNFWLNIDFQNLNNARSKNKTAKRFTILVYIYKKNTHLKENIIKRSIDFICKWLEVYWMSVCFVWRASRAGWYLILHNYITSGKHMQKKEAERIIEHIGHIKLQLNDFDRIIRGAKIQIYHFQTTRWKDVWVCLVLFYFVLHFCDVQLFEFCCWHDFKF